MIPSIAMLEDYRRYPIGIQNFEQLRSNNCVYVDKTDLVYKLTHTDQVYFLSRPRCFGKSLLVSTLESYFQGKKELFGGLAMERLEKDWEFKFDSTPEEALAQIDSKRYAVPYQTDGRKVVKVGVNFDSATRTIGEWMVR